MKLLKFKNMAMIGAMSIAGVGLVGVGAHATFTQNTASAQTIDAGTMNVQLSTLVAGASLTNGGQTLTFASPSPEGSSFTTGPMLVTITNYSSIPVTEVVSTPSDPTDLSGGPTSANSLFAAEAYLCESSSGGVIYNGLLADAPAQSINGTLSAYPLSGDTDSYTVTIYAGSGTSECGSLPSDSNDPVVTPAINSAADPAGLANGAQGGVIIPTLTVSYTG